MPVEIWNGQEFNSCPPPPRPCGPCKPCLPAPWCPPKCRCKKKKRCKCCALNSQTNIFVNIWIAGNAPPHRPNSLSYATLISTLDVSERILVEGCYAPTSRAAQFLMMPTSTSVWGGGCDDDGEGDIVEVPAFSGRLYKVLSTEDLGDARVATIVPMKRWGYSPCYSPFYSPISDTACGYSPCQFLPEWARYDPFYGPWDPTGFAFDPTYSPSIPCSYDPYGPYGPIFPYDPIVPPTPTPGTGSATFRCGAYLWKSPVTATIKVECWGAGGCGAVFGPDAGRGGGGGGYSVRQIPVTAGVNYVLQAGCGCVVGTTSFIGDGGVMCVANSFQLSPPKGASTAGAIGDTVWGGGDPGEPASTNAGGGGGSGSASGTGGNGADATVGSYGLGGTTGPGGGAGGYGNLGGFNSAQAGFTPGGGGGGGPSNIAGDSALGGDGQVTLTW